MAKDKERSINPAQAQRKLDKQKALKKGKAEIQARRNEKFARRNPDRLQRQIDELKGVQDSGQPLKPKDKQILEELERDLRAVRKAREALGDKAPTFGGQNRHNRPDERRDKNAGVLGKRRRDERDQWREPSSGSETDESVRRIPMPKDTPPPIPQQHRRNRGTNANMEPLGEGRGGGEREPHALPAKPAVQEVKTVYESAPAIRNLREEAVSKFVPTAVRKKQEAIKGSGKLVEPEEMDRLEKEGYLRSQAPEAGYDDAPHRPTFSVNAIPEPEDELVRLAAEEERFRQETAQYHVEIEEVDDEDL